MGGKTGTAGSVPFLLSVSADWIVLRAGEGGGSVVSTYSRKTFLLFHSQGYNIFTHTGISQFSILGISVATQDEQHQYEQSGDWVFLSCTMPTGQLVSADRQHQ